MRVGTTESMVGTRNGVVIMEAWEVIHDVGYHMSVTFMVLALQHDMLSSLELSLQGQCQ